MSIVEKVNDQDERLKNIEEALNTRKKTKEKKLTIKIPSKLRRQAKKETNVSVALWLGHNNKAEFKKIEYNDGLLWIGKNAYRYEEDSIYTLYQGRKQYPLVVVYEWRLTPIGGKTEEYESRILNQETASEVAEKLGLKNYGQQTIIRAIEQNAIEDEKKGRGGMKVIWIILGIVAALYFLSQMFA